MRIRKFIENPLFILLMGPPLGGIFVATYIAITSSSTPDPGKLMEFSGIITLGVFFGYFFGFIPALVTAGIANAMRQVTNALAGYLITIFLAGAISWLGIAVLDGGRGSGHSAAAKISFFAGIFAAAITSYKVFFRKKDYI